MSVDSLNLGWTGDGGFAMTMVFDDCKTAAVYFVGTSAQTADDMQWTKPASAHEIEASFKTSLDLGQGVAHCLLDQAEILRSEYWQSARAPTYVRDRVCLMGDVSGGFDSVSNAH